MTDTSNLTLVTRDLYTGSLINQVGFQMPFFTRMAQMKKIRGGGLRTAQTIEIALSDNLVQEYGEKDGLVGGSQDIFGEALWNLARLQVPIERTGLQKIMNAPKGDAQLQDIARSVVKSCTTGLRIKLAKRFWGCAIDNELGKYLTYCQGIGSAMNPSTTYGYIDRSGGQNAYWQPYDFANTATSYNLSRDLLRKWIDGVQIYADGPSKILVIMGQTLYRRMKADFEAHGVYKIKDTASVAEQGFEAIELDGFEMMSDPHLDRLTTSEISHYAGSGNARHAGLLGYQSSAPSYTGQNVVAILNMNSWDLRYVKNAEAGANEGLTHITDYFKQRQVVGGGDFDLARALTDCNLCCNHPGSNMMKINCH